MKWFKVDADFPDHPKVYKLAGQLGIDIDRAVGKVVRFWAKVAKFAEWGKLDTVPDDQIAAWMGWKKPIPQLIELLQECGFIDKGAREVHGWEERHGAMLRERDRKIAFDAAKSSARIPRAEVATKLRGSCADPRDFREISARNPDASPLPLHLQEAETEKNVALQANPSFLPKVKENPPPKPRKRRTSGLVDLAATDETTRRLWLAHLESTGRSVGGPYALTESRVKKIAILVEWAGGQEAAERGIRAHGASAWHRENGQDTLEAAALRTRESFGRWLEPKRVAPLPFDARPPVDPAILAAIASGNAERERRAAERAAKGLPPLEDPYAIPELPPVDGGRS